MPMTPPSTTSPSQPAEASDIGDASHSAAWHEFKNQLNVILAYSELLLWDLAPDDRGRRDCLEIHNSAGHIVDLIPQLRATCAPAATSPNPSGRFFEGPHSKREGNS